ncbi:copper chaperone PCu(A)C [Aureimonas altamirensis]|uniref:copper chaperone PCu(A)C n=1 Tax=Aureimonas altamirensis TaxID=370622 RepID=UPI001E5F9801|nr:copper chaperone PCu(A)C [Aureimonas altamirensis]UHD47109.1 copper chaperone PCu(A)C [Aureimonas altamirensis]
MFRHAFAALTLAASILAINPASAHDYTAGSLHIDHPWSRATPPTANVGAGYMTIQNKGPEADRLVGASTPAAQTVEIHFMEMANGVMKMRAVPEGLEIPAGGEAALAPGGYHFMLVGLEKPLTEGEKVPLELQFEKAGTVSVELAVGPIGGGSGPSGHSGH